MKQIFSLIFIFIISVFSFSACNLTPKNEITAEFVRFSIGERQTDYYLDFTIKFKNQTSKELLLNQSDFFIEINNEQKTIITFLYEYEEVFISSANLILESYEEKNLRLRVTSNINMNNKNQILVKYKDKELINDNVIFNKIN